MWRGIYNETSPNPVKTVYVDSNGKLVTGTTDRDSALDAGKSRKAIASTEESNAKLAESNESLKATVARQAKSLAQLQNDFRATVAQEQEQIKELTASMKEQASLLQKVSAQIEGNRPAPQVVSNTY